MTYTGTYTAHRDDATYTPAASPPRPKSQGTYTRAYTSYTQIGPTREGGLYIDPRVFRELRSRSESRFSTARPSSQWPGLAGRAIALARTWPGWRQATNGA